MHPEIHRINGQDDGSVFVAITFCTTTKQILLVYFQFLQHKLEKNMLQETHPLGVMSLRDVEIAATEISPIPHKSNCFIVRRKIDPVSLFLSADTQEEKNNWVRYLG